MSACGAATSLRDENIQAILQFTKSIDNWHKEHEGAAADIEFGFLNGQLALFQTRPLVDSDLGERDERLIALGATLRDASSVMISVDELPERGKTNENAFY